MGVFTSIETEKCTPLDGKLVSACMYDRCGKEKNGITIGSDWEGIFLMSAEAQMQ